MRLQSPWTPRLADEAGSACDRLVSALAEDILGGRLEVGARLPAHRDLAWRLGIGLGTVTKAYGLLERRGLVRSAKGRGTFVAVSESRTGRFIDLSRNAPPAAVSERLLARSLAAIAKRVDADVFNAYPPVTGHMRFRNELARWFLRLGMEAQPGRLLLTNGAQHALAVSLATVCGLRGTVFVEAQTYPGVIALARHLGLRLVAVAMDGEGMMPEALDRALTAEAGGAAAVYVMPTMQNPTTRSMSRTRRQDIVRVCRSHDTVIIEDDVYALAPDPAYPPIAGLAPDHVFYINSLSKTLNPTLRIGGLVVPEPWRPRAEAALQASGLMISPLSCSVMEQWLLDGTADVISAAIQEQAERRRAIAWDILGDAMHRPVHVGYHVWIPLAGPHADAVEIAAKGLGIVVTPPASTAAGGERSGLRLCIGAPSTADLRTALGAIKAILGRIKAGAGWTAG